MMTKAIRLALIAKHILCFGQPPTHLLQIPGRIEWFGSYAAFHGGYTLSSAINQYIYATSAANPHGHIRIFSSGYPAITLTLDNLNIALSERYTSIALIKGLISYVLSLGWQLQTGLDMFIQSDLSTYANLASSTAFAFALLEGIRHLQPKLPLIQPMQIAKSFHDIERFAVGQVSKIADALPMILGGTLLIDHRKADEPVIQQVKTGFTDYRSLLLQVKTQVMHPRLLAKQILDQMTIVAQHYHHPYLRDLDPLAFQHDLSELTRMYGAKTIQKATYFYAEQPRTMIAYLALEKKDEKTFFQQLKLSETATTDACDHLKIPDQTEQRLFATVHWLKTHCPEVAYRVHGMGFQGPILLLIPKATYRDTYALLKRQFYENALQEIKIVNSGSQVFKL